jgi:predicted peptidase
VLPRVWATSPGAGLDADVQFISDLIDRLQKDYNVDPTRIYVNGLSLDILRTEYVECAEQAGVAR